MRSAKAYLITWWTAGRKNSLKCGYAEMLGKMLELVQDEESLEIHVTIFEA